MDCSCDGVWEVAKSCFYWCNPQNCPCCQNTDPNQNEDDKKKNQEKTNLLGEGGGSGITAPTSSSMQRFTNLRY